MKLIYLLSLLMAAQTVTTEERLEIALANSKLLSARIDVKDKEAIFRFSEQQLQIAKAELNLVEKDRKALLAKLLEKYKLTGKNCNIDNIQAELVCDEKKEGK